MPNIKISELTAPIAVSDADILPAVQSGVTRKITWGALKATLAGALGRAHLGLGTAAVANLTTSATDATAGRVLKVGDFGLGARTPFSSYNLDLLVVTGFYSVNGNTSTNLPIPSAFGYLTVHGIDTNNTFQAFTQAAQGLVTTLTRVQISGVWQPWVESWNGTRPNSITVDTGYFGYGTGSGGAVTQATSKSTAVTLNKPSGQITTNSAALAANTAVSFTLTNNKIGANDIPKVVIKSGATAGAYVVQVDAVAAGSCRISIRNMTAGSLSETLVLQFNIEKGAAA